jgi:uncharacterized protein
VNYSRDDSVPTAELEALGLVFDGPPAETLVLLAHGAGADMHSDFMQAMASGLSASRQGGPQVQVARFNFPYMQANALDGKRRPPDRAPKLLAHLEAVLTAVLRHSSAKRIFLMGKSMGGRMAAILAGSELIDSLDGDAGLNCKARLAGVICLGYPFVPLKGGEPRLEPLHQCRLPLLIIQGERDKFGDLARVPGWDLPLAIEVKWLKDGDHSFVPRKSSGVTEAENIERAIAACLDFICV